MNSNLLFRLIRLFSISRFALLMLACLAGNSLAQVPDVRPQATGLNHPTPAQLQWMDQNMVKVGAVRLNQLALDRVNQEQKQRNLADINIPVALLGGEVIPESRLSELTSGGSTSSILPSSADNSALACFPVVRNQGDIGSCASFATTYYVATHMTGLARGWNNKNENNSTKFSPKWTYSMVNNGVDSGSWFTETIDMLLKNGAATWADFPYVGVKANSANYLEWSRSASVWRNAVNFRMAQSGSVANLDTATGLNNLKTLLANGYVALCATDIYGWQFVTFSDDLSTTADNLFVGKRVCSYVKSIDSGHAMTVVGYNDSLWVDINKNGVVDPGEKGAFKICNSWGANWEDNGFVWIAYDALRAATAVANVTDQTLREKGWWYASSWWFTAQPNYTPKLLGQFTLNHKARSTMNVSLGRSATTLASPTVTFNTVALRNEAGLFAFDGSTTAVDGTFVIDFTDIATNGANRYYLSVADNAAGNPASISDFRLTDANGNTVAAASSGLPTTADNSTRLIYIDYTMNAVPVITSANTATGMVSTVFSFNVTASGTVTSYGANNLPPGLVINTNTGVITGTPTQAGTFTASLSANNANGSGGGTLTITINNSLVPAPVIYSSISATGTVGIVFSYVIQASNAPTSFGANNLPPGITLNTQTGALGGVPTEAGSYQVELTAANGGGTGRSVLNLVINSALAGVPVITSLSAASVNAGSYFSYRITANNNPTAYGADGLPGGLVLNSISGSITGIVSVAREYSITLRATNAVGVGYQTLTLTVLGDSSFGPANDHFANRSVLVGTNLSTVAGNINATAQTNEPPHAGQAAAKSVWWSWVAPANGRLVVDTVGSDFDTVMEVYTGTNIESLVSVASSDDTTTNRVSGVSFVVGQGTACQIAVDGFGGIEGNILLNLKLTGNTPPPANDLFANAITLAGATVSTAGQNYSATAQTGESAHAGYSAKKSVWWNWTAPTTASVQINTIGSDFDTVLAVYAGSAVTALTPVASADEGGGNYTSLLTFNATAGVNYRIAVDGFGGAEGNIVLSIKPVFNDPGNNDNFENRIRLTGMSASTAGQNTNATLQPNEPQHAGVLGGHSVWWTWTAPTNGLTRINTAGSSFDTLLAAYTGSYLGGLVEVASDDDGDTNRTSLISFNASAGTTYQIAVDGFSGDKGLIQVSLLMSPGAPLNDDLANAFAVAGTAFTGFGRNFYATVEPNEVFYRGVSSSNTVWWKWTAPASGEMTLSTEGSDFDTTLAVYSGGRYEYLGLVIYNDDDPTAMILTSKTSFFAEAGKDYRFQIDGYGGDQGNIILTGIMDTNSSTLYSTDFEFFGIGNNTIVGYDGWLGVDTQGGNEGTYSPAFNGMGTAGLIGGMPIASGVSNVFLYRPVNFDPVGAKRPLVTFSADVAVFDSSNSNYDDFMLVLYNRSGNFLAAIDFDNGINKIRFNNGSSTNTGKSFLNNTRYSIEWHMDFQNNKCWAALSGVLLFTNLPIRADTRVLDVGDIDFVWTIFDPGAPGDNYMTFDNYLLNADPIPTVPTIVTPPAALVVEAGGMATFSVLASGTAPFTYQWQWNSVKIPGATNVAYTLLNVNSNQAGYYRVSVSNAVGGIISTTALLTVTPPRPSAVISKPIYSSRGVQFQVSGPPGHIYTLEASTNMTQWIEITTVVNQNGTVTLLDTGATNNPRRFYRVRDLR